MIASSLKAVVYAVGLVLALVIQCHAFTPMHRPPSVAVHSLAETRVTTALHVVPPVEVFDGSGIDPVVVSNVFWTRLQANFINVLIGNFLAAIVFSFLMSQAAIQLSKLGAFVTESIFKGDKGTGGSRASTTSTFQRADAVSSPVNVDLGKLILCIAIDVIGSASELVPVLGEVTDVVWAPIAGLALRSLFGSNIVFALEFTEEFLPFTDILPLATLCWVVDTFFSDSDLAKALGLGKGRAIRSSDAIDVDASSENISRFLDSDSKKRQ
jgi:uncharacterized membrane protein YciS (DUF1049 family)